MHDIQLSPNNLCVFYIFRFLTESPSLSKTPFIKCDIFPSTITINNHHYIINGTNVTFTATGNLHVTFASAVNLHVTFASQLIYMLLLHSRLIYMLLLYLQLIYMLILHLLHFNSCKKLSHYRAVKLLTCYIYNHTII